MEGRAASTALRPAGNCARLCQRPSVGGLRAVAAVGAGERSWRPQSVHARVPRNAASGADLRPTRVALRRPQSRHARAPAMATVTPEAAVRCTGMRRTSRRPTWPRPCGGTPETPAASVAGWSRGLKTLADLRHAGQAAGARHRAPTSRRPPGRCRAGAGPCGPLPGARRPGAVVCQAGGGGCGPTCWSRPTSGASCGRRVGRVNSRPPWDARSAFRPHGCSDGGRPLPDERCARRSVSRETACADPLDRRGARQTTTVVGSTPKSGVRPHPHPHQESTPPPGLP